MTQMYGEWVIDSQNLKNIVKKDDLVKNIVQNAIDNGPALSQASKSVRGGNFGGTFSFDNSKKQAMRVYRDQITKTNIHNLGRFGRKLES